MSKDKPTKSEDEYFARRDAELIRQSQERELAQRQEADRRQHYMKCPKDGYDLTTREEHGVQVDVCGHCGGLWLDAGELEQLIRLSEQPGMIRRVVKDVMSALGRKPVEPEKT